MVLRAHTVYLTRIIVLWLSPSPFALYPNLCVHQDSVPFLIEQSKHHNDRRDDLTGRLQEGSNQALVRPIGRTMNGSRRKCQVLSPFPFGSFHANPLLMRGELVP
ncbi:hypothetical protein AcW2_006862 [Taiwanofungus camphoratus]|nr:hypothetical protein AcW2_006862 [Antrodia cinnamomea]